MLNVSKLLRDPWCRWVLVVALGSCQHLQRAIKLGFAGVLVLLIEVIEERGWRWWMRMCSESCFGKLR